MHKLAGLVIPILTKIAQVWKNILDVESVPHRLIAFGSNLYREFDGTIALEVPQFYSSNSVGGLPEIPSLRYFNNFPKE